MGECLLNFEFGFLYVYSLPRSCRSERNMLGPCAGKMRAWSHSPFFPCNIVRNDRIRFLAQVLLHTIVTRLKLVANGFPQELGVVLLPAPETNKEYLLEVHRQLETILSHDEFGAK